MHIALYMDASIFDDIVCASSSNIPLHVPQTDTIAKANPKMLTQFQHCEDTGIPFAAVLGQTELEEGVVTLRDMRTREEIKVCIEFSGEIKVCIEISEEIKVCIEFSEEIKVYVKFNEEIKVCVKFSEEIKVCVKFSEEIKVCVKFTTACCSDSCAKSVWKNSTASHM